MIRIDILETSKTLFVNCGVGPAVKSSDKIAKESNIVLVDAKFALYVP